MKNQLRLKKVQRGATLVIALVMLAVIMILVTSAYTLSSTNLQAVGNMQFRTEATAAANVAIEQVVSSFTSTLLPTAQTIQVNLNNDGATYYQVAIVPVCITSTYVAASAGIGQQSSANLGSGFTTVGGNGGFMSTWDIQASVTDSVSGATIVAHQGMRKLLSSDCP